MGKNIYSSYMKSLNKKINKTLNKGNLSNDDLHDLFHYYDTLYCYDYYLNEAAYKAKIEKWKSEFIEEGEDSDL